MWGNRKGWAISGVLFLFVLTGVWWLGRLMEVSAPDAFGLSAGNTSVLEMPLSPWQVVPAGSEGDSAEVYFRAIGVTRQNLAEYERFLRDGRLPDLPRVKEAAELMLKGREAGRGGVFGKDAARVIGFDSPNPDLQAVELLARVCLRISSLTRDADISNATRYSEAVFAVGAQLHEERFTYPEMELGLRLMAEASAAMKELAVQAGNTDRAAMIDSFDQARTSYYRERVLPVVSRIRSMDGGVIARNAGNVRYWAQHAEERVWRTESVLALGRLRFYSGNPPRPGNQRGATALLLTMEGADDRVIAPAVRAALDLTAEEFRQLR